MLLSRIETRRTCVEEKKNKPMNETSETLLTCGSGSVLSEGPSTNTSAILLHFPQVRSCPLIWVRVGRRLPVGGEIGENPKKEERGQPEKVFLPEKGSMVCAFFTSVALWGGASGFLRLVHALQGGEMVPA